MHGCSCIPEESSSIVNLESDLLDSITELIGEDLGQSPAAETLSPEEKALLKMQADAVQEKAAFEKKRLADIDAAEAAFAKGEAGAEKESGKEEARVEKEKAGALKANEGLLATLTTKTKEQEKKHLDDNKRTFEKIVAAAKAEKDKQIKTSKDLEAKDVAKLKKVEADGKVVKAKAEANFQKQQKKADDAAAKLTVVEATMKKAGTDVKTQAEAEKNVKTAQTARDTEKDAMDKAAKQKDEAAAAAKETLDNTTLEVKAKKEGSDKAIERANKFEPQEVEVAKQKQADGIEKAPKLEIKAKVVAKETAEAEKMKENLKKGQEGVHKKEHAASEKTAKKISKQKEVVTKVEGTSSEINVKADKNVVIGDKMNKLAKKAVTSARENMATIHAFQEKNEGTGWEAPSANFDIAKIQKSLAEAEAAKTASHLKELSSKQMVKDLNAEAASAADEAADTVRETKVKTNAAIVEAKAANAEKQQKLEAAAAAKARDIPPSQVVAADAARQASADKAVADTAEALTKAKTEQKKAESEVKELKVEAAMNPAKKLRWTQKSRKRRPQQRKKKETWKPTRRNCIRRN